MASRRVQSRPRLARRSRPPRRRRALLALVALLLVAAVFTLPVPGLYVYLPGPVRDVERLVSVRDARAYSSEGVLFLTTVNVDVRATAAELVAAVFHPHRDVVLERQVTRGLTLEQLERAQHAQMASSKRRAREVAFAALGLGEPTGEGARVVRVQPRTPAAGVLRRDDVIVAVDGETIATACDLTTALDAAGPGSSVELTVRRGAERRAVSIVAARHQFDPSTGYLGVATTDVGYRFEPGVAADFSTGEIAGPSAGLMLSLALYDRLTPEDLTGGRRIAGTGTIGCGGRVSAVGGIEQKVVAAARVGAELFIVPARNAAEARAAAGDIDVVPVRSFADALAVLEGDAG